MTDVDELRHVLDQQAGLAPDGVGVAETALRRARQWQRRRRVVQTLAAVVGVAAVAVTSIAVAARPGSGRAVPTTIGTAASYRETSQFTVELATDPQWFALGYALGPTTQDVEARVRTSPDRTGEVLVYNPGTFDASVLDRDQRTTVQGHDAFYVPDLVLRTLTGERSGSLATFPVNEVAQALVWQDRSGAWVVVSVYVIQPGHTTMADVAALAELVRLVPPYELRAPFSFTYLPPGLSLQRGYTRTMFEQEVDVMVLLGPPGGSEPVDYRDGSLGRNPAFPLSIRALSRNKYVDINVADLGPATKIAGLDTWEVSTGLLIQTATCQIAVSTRSPGQVSPDDMKRIVEGATFGSCADRSAWQPPVP
jgi:hypothetical protein